MNLGLPQEAKRWLLRWLSPTLVHILSILFPRNSSTFKDRRLFGFSVRLMSLLGDFCGSSQEVVEREGPAASAGEDFFECEEEPAPAVEKPSRPSWSNWFRRMA